MPTTLILTVGSHPRRLLERTSGLLFFWLFDTAGNLLSYISYDNGGSFEGPFTVASGLTPQQVDGEFCSDGSLLVSYFDAGVWSQRRSRDLGRTWS